MSRKRDIELIIDLATAEREPTATEFEHMRKKLKRESARTLRRLRGALSQDNNNAGATQE